MEIYGDTCFYIAKEGNTCTPTVHNSSKRRFASLTHIYAAAADSETRLQVGKVTLSIFMETEMVMQAVSFLPLNQHVWRPGSQACWPGTDSRHWGEPWIRHGAASRLPGHIWEMDSVAEQGGTCVMMGPGFRCCDSPTYSLGVIQKGLKGVLSQILEDVLEGKVWVALWLPQVSRQFESYSFSTFKWTTVKQEASHAFLLAEISLSGCLPKCTS